MGIAIRRARKKAVKRRGKHAAKRVCKPIATKRKPAKAKSTKRKPAKAKPTKRTASRATTAKKKTCAAPTRPATRKAPVKSPRPTPLNPVNAAPGTAQPSVVNPIAPVGAEIETVPADRPAVPEPPAPPTGPIDAPIPVYSGPFGPAQAERLLFRAGFGPRPGDIAVLAELGLEAAVKSFTRPEGPAILSGPEPTSNSGGALAPNTDLGHDHAYWLDRMVRSDQQLVERMALVFHDWFATSNEVVQEQHWMLDQTDLFRRHALGSFKDLVYDIGSDPATITWLDLFRSSKDSVNENFARELMELFTLGVGRGAYTEDDVSEVARSLTGWQGVYNDAIGRLLSFTYVETRHDSGLKTVFGQTGNYDWTDIARMVVEHPMHASFFVAKLWGYFIPTPPSDGVLSALAELYADGGHAIRPVLEAILCSPDMYVGPTMVKPPVVYHAGMLRALGRGITRSDWYWYCAQAGQRLYYPPDVSGWDDQHWLDTNTLRMRWVLASQSSLGKMIPGEEFYTHSITETAAEAVSEAAGIWGKPNLSAETIATLESYADTFERTSPSLVQRQNMLRQLIPCVPDYQVC